MTIKDIQEEIIRLKKEKDFCILAHAYQGHEILEVADYMGDSYNNVRCAFYGRDM